MPVLMVSLKTCPHVGFSRKRSTAPSSRVMTIPNSSGFSTAERARVASAPFCSWNSTTALRSMSVRTSPEITRKRSASSSRALSTEPAVPSGVSSVAYTMRTPSSEPSPKYVRTAFAMNATVTTISSIPWRRSSLTTCSIMGRLAMGSMGFGWLDVRGRSLVPSPPAMITAFTHRPPRALAPLVAHSRRRRHACAWRGPLQARAAQVRSTRGRRPRRARSRLPLRPRR